MRQNRIRMIMPASAADAFEAFHDHDVRMRWDSLLSRAEVEGGGSHPYVGAITFNQGRGWKRFFAMRTRFVNYQPGRVAAAVLVEPAGWFEGWAASMQHRDIDDARSELIYTFRIQMRPRWLGRVLDPLVNRLFEYETRRRFAAMAEYLRARD
ncbi:SRPBCC family protein [Pseudomonas cichorii]|uniref:SRPBCC family protein n=1 Tax=Pseudomonas lijiangensis TaxID=2995658 RepID=A0ABX8HVM1_9PSED|nr:MULTISPECIES: SRPBCC family protein [Pseudomonas syringae group]MBI6855034.1 SRPBCC family protein [Pseudomonas cichorii]MBX8500416.1 SRPBCC family protein [Pseudomonas lijiangensis]MBX8505125.1 SRPBCC family protein [Pseudomonas lijiangensis]MBX8511758.1 SRPBCC family protein [Pseudomonas cichorii]MBX8525397.1 SRPBCC family protein [Pseudomonas cichorii]